MLAVNSRFGFGNVVGKSLLASDLVLLLIFVFLGVWLHADGASMPYIWHISPEFSISSLVLFLKWLLGAVFCFMAFRAGAGAAAAASAAIFLLLFFDDVFQIHDLNLNLLGTSKSVQILLGLIFLSSLALGFLKQKPATRMWFFQFNVLLAGLLFCGLVVDRVADHFSSPSGLLQTVIGRLVAIAEDGGEMVFGSLMAGHAFDMLRASKRID